MRKRRLWRFPGGLRLAGNKRISTGAPIEVLPLPERIVLPLRQHAGQPAVPVVSAGERVLGGQLVARADTFVSANVHASTSGTVLGIETHPIPHASGVAEPCVIIRPDGEDAWASEPGPVASPWSASAAELLERIRQAGIVGLGGAVFPSSAKLKPTRVIDTLVVNGVECEPYITCDDMLMRARPGDVLRAALLLRRVVGARECVVAVEDNKPEAAAALRAALPELSTEHAGFTLEVVEVPTRFPAGGEKQLIKVLTGREVPSGGLPYEVGVVCVNVGTAAAVHDAVFLGRPLVSRTVTVTGAAVGKPRNYEVRLGTPVFDLLAAAGGCTTDNCEIVLGGPMMGYPLHDHRVPVAKGSNCVLLREPIPTGRPVESMPCIRCGACASACPMRLVPQQLYWHARGRQLEKVQDYRLFDCIECGCCTQVCPADIPLVQYYRYAKHAIREERRRKEQAGVSRQRNIQRKERLERLEREKAARRAKARQRSGGGAEKPRKRAPRPGAVASGEAS